jgi:hypothetical protein
MSENVESQGEETLLLVAAIFVHCNLIMEAALECPFTQLILDPCTDG